jgi:hypothetical protein
MTQELLLRIILEKPPAGVDFGLQKGRGSDYETIQTHRADGNDLKFEFPVGIKKNTAVDQPDFSGPFVQGPRDQRFIYIDIGTYAGQTDTIWSRRLKIPLIGITWAMIDQLSERSMPVLETRVRGTGSDGGPSCATVKPFSGWRVSSI